MRARPLATLFLAAVVYSGACATTSRVGQFNDTVVYGGLWFADAECARQFAAPRLIRDHEMDAFKRCIESLDLHPGKRHYSLGTVFEYGPGLEVKARYLEMNDGRLLASIAFVGDRRPTITPAALESLRIAGSPTPVLDEATRARIEATIMPPAKLASMAVRVCIDDTGAVSSVTPVGATSLALVGVMDRFTADWRFKPFVWNGTPRGVCSIIRLVHPADSEAVNWIPISASEAPYPVVSLPIAAQKFPMLSESMMRALVKSRSAITAAARFCIDETGAVSSVDLIEPSGSPAFDRALVTNIRRRKPTPYLVDGQAVRVCSYAVYGLRLSMSGLIRPEREVTRGLNRR